MRDNALRALWVNKVPLGWVVDGSSSVSAEIMAHAGFDWSV